jgi:hypothetical protein
VRCRRLVKLYETLRSVGILIIGFLIFGIFWEYAPDNVADRVAQFMLALLVIVMAAPLLLIFVDTPSSTEASGSRWRFSPRLSISGFAIFVLYANWIVFIVLAIYFDGGAYPWGEIRDGQYFIVAQMTETEISHKWFWITYWQGLTVWAGTGIYGLFGISNQLLKSSQQDDHREPNQHVTGLLIASLWTVLVFWGAVKIIN